MACHIKVPVRYSSNSYVPPTNFMWQFLLSHTYAHEQPPYRNHLIQSSSRTRIHCYFKSYLFHANTCFFVRSQKLTQHTANITFSQMKRQQTKWNMCSVRFDLEIWESQSMFFIYLYLNLNVNANAKRCFFVHVCWCSHSKWAPVLRRN